MTIALFAHPGAGRGRAVSVAARVRAHLETRGARVDLLHPAEIDIAVHLRGAARPDLVIVVGGDGSVRPLLEHLVGSDLALLIVPVGTGNDLATALQIPRDPVAAADAAFDGEDVLLDVGRATSADGSQRLFASVLASGFDSLVNDRANRLPVLRGRARYNAAIAIEFALLRRFRYRLHWTSAAGSSHGEERDLLLAAVGNTSTYGGGIPICPDADPTDRLLDVVTVRPAPRRRLIPVLARAFRGKHVTAQEVDVRRVRSVQIDAAGLTSYADGDALAALPLTVDVHPDRLRLRVPRRTGS